MKLLYNLPYILVIFFIVIFISRSYFGEGVPYTHDGENHLARFANYEIAIREHQFPPRFAPNFLNHYGYPVFNYNYPLANIISLPFSFVKIHYETTFKIQIFLSLFLGGIGIYFWTATFTDKKHLRLLSTFFYYSSPYLISAVIFRGAIGEIMAYAFFPWLCMSIHIMKNKDYFKLLIFPIICLMWAAFFLAHNVSVVLMAPVIALVAVFLFKKKHQLYIHLIVTVLIAILISLWFWLPAMMERDQIIVNTSGNNQLLFSHFPSITQLLFAPVEFGYSFEGNVDSFSFSLGFISVVTLFISIMMLVFYKKKYINKYDDTILPWFIISLGLVLFQCSFSKPIWSLFPFLKFVQFPWRLSLLLSFSLIPIFIFLFQRSKLFFKALLIIILISQCLFLWKLKPIDTLHKDRENYVAFGQTSTTQNENFPKTFKYLDVGDWAPTALLIEGEGTINIITWAGSKRTYELDLKTESTIVEPTMYFLGWETYANNNKVEYTDSEKIAGRIAYKLNPGKYVVTSKFTEKTPMRIIGDTVSIISILLLGVYSIAIAYKIRTQAK